MAVIQSITPNRIQYHRERLGISESELAKFLDVSAVQLARWESGQAAVPHSVVQKIALEWGLAINRLVVPQDEHARQLLNNRRERDELWGDDTHDLPWGTFRFWVKGVDDCFEFPIDHWNSVTCCDELNDRSGFGAKIFMIETMNNRLLVLNTDNIKMVELISDDEEEMPAYYHQEVYKAMGQESLDDAVETVNKMIDGQLGEEDLLDIALMLHVHFTDATMHSILFDPMYMNTIMEWDRKLRPELLFQNEDQREWQFIKLENEDRPQFYNVDHIGYISMPLLEAIKGEVEPDSD